MAPQRRAYDHVAFLVLAACAAWTCYWHFVVPVLPYDDAFIAFRYVDHFSHGLGLTYNPPQRVWGYTSPLYVFWLTGLSRVIAHVDLPTLAVRANAIWLLTAGGATFGLTRHYTKSLVASTLTAAVVVAHPAMLTVSTGGMESMLFVSLALMTLLMLAQDRPTLAGIALGLACLTRPEGVLLAPIVAWTFRRSWSRFFWSAGAALLIVGPWLLFAWSYYGTIVPLPIVAKNRPVYPLPAGYAFRTMSGYLRGAVFGAPSGRWTAACNVVFGTILAGAVASAVAYEPMRRRQAWAIVAFTGMLLAFYTFTNPMFFQWYWPAVFVGVVVTLATGATALVQWLRRPAVGAVLAVCAVVACALSYRDNSGRDVKSVRFLKEDATRLRVTTYRAIAEWLNPLAHSRDSVAAPEIGAFGYYYKGPVLDACGLVSPEALPFLPVPDDERMGPATGAISVGFVRATNPLWVVTMPIFAQKSLLTSDWFAGSYYLIREVPLIKPAFDNTTVLVFKKK